MDIGIIDNLQGDIGKHIQEAVYHFKTHGASRKEIIVMLPAYIKRILEFKIITTTQRVPWQPSPANMIKEYFFGVSINWEGYENKCVVYLSDWHEAPVSIREKLKPQILELKPPPIYEQ